MKYFEDNIKLAYHISSRFEPTIMVDRDDIKQLALIGLHKASKTFKKELGFAFSTFAYRVMRNEILKAMEKERFADSIDEIELEIEDDRYTPDSEYMGSLENFSHVITKQEFDIVGLTVQGYNQKEISEQVGLSQSQVSRIFLKAKSKIAKEVGIWQY